MKKGTGLGLLLVVWILLVVGASGALYTGQLSSVIPPSALPGGEVAAIGIAVAGIVLGLVVYWNRKSAAWRSMGRRAGLAPEGGSILPLGQPELAGTVDGRSVRVRTKSLKSGGSTEGSSRTVHTVIEADLPSPATDGVMIARADPGATDQEGFDVGGLSVRMTSVGGPFGATGSDALADAVLTDRVRESLGALETMDVVLVGAASDAITEAVPDAGDSWLGGKMLDSVDEAIAGDTSTVTHQFAGTLLDGDELERQVRAVTDVADAFERATAEPASA